MQMHNPHKDDNSVNNCNCRFQTERQNLRTAALNENNLIFAELLHRANKLILVVGVAILKVTDSSI